MPLLFIIIGSLMIGIGTGSWLAGIGVFLVACACAE